ncbi:GNAT family N-acetyltransferase [Halobacterium litoreum]|uniref:GNAT family N-acetyltransferase n=1 Tax=Halobacterium litoreum TaxID=2039234 RepID=A0ABD5NBJ4_9EURY|nr:GNAT family N-acetyltransferase [Halobacterium litoreum]UHH14451.1 GNAT family N-acetyltransferase [Halobacterium litoreum]
MDDSLVAMWPRGLRPPTVAMPEGYALRTTDIAGDDEDAVASLVGEGTVADYRNRALPNGWFVAVERATNRIVGTCAALHDPDGEDPRFPFGGRVAALAVDSAHRERGVGRALAAAATRRLLDAGYDSVRVRAPASATPALHVAVTAGYAPCVVADGDVGRWRAAFDAIGLPFDPSQCVRHDGDSGA